MADPLSALTTGKKFLDYTFQLISASAESREAKKYLEQFVREYDELCRLANSTWSHLDENDRLRLQQVICDAREAIASVAEPNQKSLKDVKRFGTVTIYGRVMWTLRDKDAIKLCMRRVHISHASVSREIGTLQAVAREVRATPLGTAGEEIPTTSNDFTSSAGSGHKGTQDGMTWLGELFARNNRQSTASIVSSNGDGEGLAWLGEEFHRRKSDDIRRRSQSREPAGEPT